MSQLRTGVIEVDSAGPSFFEPGATRLEVRSRSGVPGYGISGSVEVEELVLPGPESWGEMTGHIDAQVVYQDPYTEELVDSGRVTAQFAVPLPSEAARAGNRSGGGPGVGRGGSWSLLGRKWPGG